MGSGYYPIDHYEKSYKRVMRALRVLNDVADGYSEAIQENDQTDNAVYDGMYQQDFRRGITLIEGCLQHSEEERLKRLKTQAERMEESIEHLELKVLRRSDPIAWAKTILGVDTSSLLSQSELLKITEGYGNWDRICAARILFNVRKEATDAERKADKSTPAEETRC